MTYVISCKYCSRILLINCTPNIEFQGHRHFSLAEHVQIHGIKSPAPKHFIYNGRTNLRIHSQ